MAQLSPLDKLKQFNATFKLTDNKVAIVENKPTAKPEIAEIVATYKTQGVFMKSKVKQVMIDQIMLLNGGGGRGRMKVEITIETIQGENNYYFSIPVSMPTGVSMGSKSYIVQVDRLDTTNQYLLTDFGINAQQISDLVKNYLSKYFLA